MDGRRAAAARDMMNAPGIEMAAVETQERHKDPTIINKEVLHGSMDNTSNDGSESDGLESEDSSEGPGLVDGNENAHEADGVANLTGHRMMPEDHADHLIDRKILYAMQNKPIFNGGPAFP